MAAGSFCMILCALRPVGSVIRDALEKDIKSDDGRGKTVTGTVKALLQRY
jgi:uncharacterized protein YwbE